MTEKPKSEPEEQPPVLKAEELFQGGKEIIILHEGEQYRLRITRRGKLILNK